MTTKPLKIGIIGGGMMAQVGHIPFLLDHPGCEVTCVAESRPSLVAHLKGHFGVRTVVSDHRELLASPEIDAVVLSAPRPSTGPLSLEVLEKGKHLLAEKPMAHSAAQAQKLVDCAFGPCAPARTSTNTGTSTRRKNTSATIGRGTPTARCPRRRTRPLAGSDHGRVVPFGDRTRRALPVTPGGT